MAMSPSEVEAFIEAIQQDPLLRDRVRNAIIAEDFLALPGIVARLGERIEQLTERIDRLTVRMDQLTERMDQFAYRMDQLTERMNQLALRMDQLTERMDQLAVRMDQLTARMDDMTLRMDELIKVTTRLDGRTGNLEGWRFEAEYQQRLASHLVRRYRNVRPLVLGNHPQLLAALDNGTIDDSEWEDLVRLDAAAQARHKGSEDDLVVVLELSKTIDVNDVERAARRADIIRKAGVLVEACVDGEQIQHFANERAGQLGVFSFVKKIAEPAL